MEWINHELGNVAIRTEQYLNPMNKLSKNPLTYILVFFILLSLFAIHDYAVVYCKMQNLIVDSVWKNIHIFIIFLILFFYISLLFLSNRKVRKCVIISIFILLLLFLFMTLTVVCIP